MNNNILKAIGGGGSVRSGGGDETILTCNVSRQMYSVLLSSSKD